MFYDILSLMVTTKGKPAVDTQKVLIKESEAYCHKNSLNYNGRQQERELETKDLQNRQKTIKRGRVQLSLWS